MHAGNAFEKAQGMISDMIAKLESDENEDATRHIATQLAESNAMEAAKTDAIEQLSTKIAQLAAKSQVGAAAMFADDAFEKVQGMIYDMIVKLFQVTKPQAENTDKLEQLCTRSNMNMSPRCLLRTALPGQLHRG